MHVTDVACASLIGACSGSQDLLESLVVKVSQHGWDEMAAANIAFPINGDHFVSRATRLTVGDMILQVDWEEWVDLRPLLNLFGRVVISDVLECIDPEIDRRADSFPQADGIAIRFPQANHPHAVADADVIQLLALLNKSIEGNLSRVPGTPESNML